MKKLFFGILAMAAFAACSNENTIVTPQGAAIAFGDAFVDNSTKAIYEGDAVPNEFKVWGNVQGTNATPVALYGNDGANVQGNGVGSVYTCEEVRYWTPSCDFNFAAIAHGTAKTVEGGLPTEISYTLDSIDPADLLYATASAETDGSGTPTGTIATIDQDKLVAFTFNHLLAKMYFNVTSGLDSAYSIEVKSISVAGFENKGVYTISPAGWAKADDSAKTTLTFANGAGGAKVIIPVNQTLSVTITYDVKFGETTISTNATKTGTIAACTYEKNTVYKISAVIGLNAIQFTTTAISGFGTDEQNGTVTIQ